MRYGRTFVEGGFRVAIVKEGPKWAKAVFIDGSNVKVRKVKGAMTITPIEGYTLRKLACVMLRRKNSLSGKRHISKGARKILEDAKV